jgi:signal peptidase
MNLTTHPRSRTVGQALLAVLVLALIAPFVVYAVPGTVGAEASYIVLTASMTPAIAPGDVVVVDDVPARLVGEGDVIVFEQQAGAAVPVTHRVVAVERAADGTPSFVTQGDANEDADLTPVTPDRLVGRVLFTIPLIGHVIQFVGTPVGFAALVVLPLGLLIASEVAALLRSGRTPEPAAAAVTDDDGGDDGDDGGVPAPPADDRPSAPPNGASTADQLTFTPADLTLSSAVLGVFTAYAGYAAYTRPAGLTVGVAVAAGATLALAVGMRSFALPESAVTGGGSHFTAPEVSVDGGAATGPSVTVATPADIERIADAVGRPLLRTEAEYVVLDGAVTYACAIPDEPAAGVEDPVDAGTRNGAADGPVYGPTSAPDHAPDEGESEAVRALTTDGGDRP